MTTMEPEIGAQLESDIEEVVQGHSHKVSANHAVILSVVIVLLLIGGMVGMFVATAAKEDNIVQNETVISSAEWLGEQGVDAAPNKQEDSNNYAPSDNEFAPSSAPTPSVKDEEVDPVLSVDEKFIKRGKVKKGVPVIKSLTRLGLSVGDAQLIINAFDGIFDFRKARPGHAFELRTNPKDGTPTSFRYEASRVNVYEVRKRSDGFKGRKINIPTKKIIRVFGGTIARSLYGALSDLGAKPSLTGLIVDVLSTQVNFYKEQRPGDTFRVMLEEETLGGDFLGYGPVLGLEYNGVKSGKKRFFHFKPGDSRATYYDQKGISVPRSVIMIPLHYSRLSSPFGMRYHPVLKRKKLHNGVDFAASNGTPVWACAEGSIITAGKRGANGNLVSINHGNGLSSHYAHLSRFGPGIRSGVKVRQKQVIGYVGSTGRSTGPHLHWGLKKNGKFLDPLKYKIRPGRPVAARYRSKLSSTIKERGARMDRVRIHGPKQPLVKLPEAGLEVLGLEDDF